MTPPEQASGGGEKDELRLAALAESTLRWRRNLQDAADTLIVDMIRDNDAVSAIAFNTPGGRPCLLVLAVGDEASSTVADKLKQELTEEVD